MPLALALHDDGAVSCAAVPWRVRGRLQVTIVVKITLAIVPDGVATVLAPEPVNHTDKHRDADARRSLELASETAPYLPRCDVLFTGHAYAVGGGARAVVRLGVAGGGRPLLDKTIQVFGDRASPDARPAPFERLPIVYERAFGGLGEPNPVGKAIPNLVDPIDARRPAALGPVLRWWPARKQLLGGVDARTIDAALPQKGVPTVDLPNATRWEYFQAAPPDQQIDYLRGDEWLVLDGVHAKLARLQTKLPGVRGVARVADADRSSARQADRLELVCDRLAIDGDRQTVTLLWRGRVDVEEAASLSRLLVAMAALESPGSAVDWMRILERGPSQRAPLDAAPAAQRPLSLVSTALPDAQSTSSPPLPFELNVPAAQVIARMPAPRLQIPVGPKVDTRTVALRREDILPTAGSLPFARSEEAPRLPPLSPSPMSPPVAPAEVLPPPARPAAVVQTSSLEFPSPTPAPAVGVTPAVVATVATSMPPPELTMKECGALAASVARRSDDRAQILEARGMTDEVWRALHERWVARVQGEVEKGKAALLSEYDCAYVGQLVNERGPIAAEDYARIVVAVERRTTDEVMREMGLPVEAVGRIRRVWIAKMAADVEQGALARRAIEAERAR